MRAVKVDGCFDPAVGAAIWTLAPGAAKRGFAAGGLRLSNDVVDWWPPQPPAEAATTQPNEMLARRRNTPRPYKSFRPYGN